MPRNGSGIFTLAQPPFTPNTRIQSSAVNSDLADIASGLTGSLPRDGQAGMTGTLPLAASGFNFTVDQTTGVERTAAGEMSFKSSGVVVGKLTPNGFADGAGNLLNPFVLGVPYPWIFPNPPAGCVFVYGQPCTSAYPQLRALLIANGSIFGNNGTDPLFPDMRGLVVAGKDNMGGAAAGRLTNGLTLGAVIGAQSVTLDATMMPAHTHSGTTASAGSHNHTGASGAAGTHSHTGTTDSSGDHSHGGATDTQGDHYHTGTGGTSSDGDHSHSVSGGTSGPSINLNHNHSNPNTGSIPADIGASVALWTAGTGSVTNIGNTGFTDLNHTHTVTGSTNTTGAHTHTVSVTTSTNGAHLHNILTATNGAHTHTFTTSTAPDHTHAISSDGAHTHTFTTSSVGGGGSHTNVQPTIVLNYIMRAA